MIYKKHIGRQLGLNCQGAIPDMLCAKLQTISDIQKSIVKKAKNNVKINLFLICFCKGNVFLTI